MFGLSGGLCGQRVWAGFGLILLLFYIFLFFS